MSPQQRDPRTTRRYRKTRAEWLPTQAGLRCWLCDKPVDVTLPGTHDRGPTVEHRLPIRTILANAGSWDAAVDLCCDTSMWALAHLACQRRQGALVSNVTRHGNPERRPSRAW